jgi:hypothetical protein
LSFQPERNNFAYEPVMMLQQKQKVERKEEEIVSFIISWCLKEKIVITGSGRTQNN